MFENNALEVTFSKENTLNTMSGDEEVDKLNELETTAMTANNVNADNATEREACSSFSSPRKVTSPENTSTSINDENGASMNSILTKTSKFMKQHSLNKNLFKGLKKKYFEQCLFDHRILNYVHQ